MGTRTDALPLPSGQLISSLLLGDVLFIIALLALARLGLRSGFASVIG
jgi:hypothetical protein